MFTAQWFRLGGRVAHHLTRRYKPIVVLMSSINIEIVKIISPTSLWKQINEI